MAQKKTGEIGRTIDTPANFIEENLYSSICEQCKWYDISRSQYYYTPTTKEDKFYSLKEKIKEKYTLDPSSGSRRITAALNRDGINVQRGLIRRLMKTMNIQGLCPKKRLSIPDDSAHKFPYLLRDIEVIRPNQVWSTDITYIITERGHMYLTAIIDIYSRKILSWELSNSLTKEFCITCFNKAVSKYGAPEILNTDQGSQYTSTKFVETVLNAGSKLSMDGKGRCLDNVWIERFWRTIKYDFLFLYEFKGSLNLYKGIRWFICYYNDERCHSSLGHKTPNEVYETSNLTFKKIKINTYR